MIKRRPNAPLETDSEPDDPIPAPPDTKRPGLNLDPIERMKWANVAKWVLCLAFVSFIAWLPSQLYPAYKALPLKYTYGFPPAAKIFFDLSVAFAATFFAGIVATGVPRLLFPKIFGKWNAFVEAFRDWIVVGVCTAIPYFLTILLMRALHIGQFESSNKDWAIIRLPLVMVCSILGLFLARKRAIQSESILGSGHAILQIGLQMVLIGGFTFLFGTALYAIIFTVPLLHWGLLFTWIVLGALGVGILTWAWAEDRKLVRLQKDLGDSRGTYTGGDCIELVLAVVGSRASGKSTLLAGAYWEWTTQRIGPFRIVPSADSQSLYSNNVGRAASIEEVARKLYKEREKPIGNVACRHLPFDLLLDNELVARFYLLDYPGRALNKNDPAYYHDKQAVDEFWRQIHNCDGLLMVADMGYVRRDKFDPDFDEVMQTYKTAISRIVERSGRTRVVPAAMVLTKTDEFINPTRNSIDNDKLLEGLRKFKYDELENEWKETVDRMGPGFTEFQKFKTSAFTHTRPQRDLHGRPLLEEPYEFADPPPNPEPSGCASPLLWITSKAMRWNITLFSDLQSFVWGPSKRSRKHIDAMLELERIAMKRASIL